MIIWPNDGEIVDVHLSSGEALLGMKLLQLKYRGDGEIDDPVVLAGSEHTFYIEPRHIAYIVGPKLEEEETG